MCSRSVARKTALAVAAALLMLAPALAGAQTAAEKSCILSMNKAGAKLTATQGKENSGCINAKVAGKLMIGETVDQCVTADHKGKIAKATTKTSDTQTAKCPSTPPYGFGGATATNTAGVDEQITLARSIFLGGPITTLNAAITVQAGACQTAVAKAYEKFAATRMKDFNACKNSGFKANTITDASDLIACEGYLVDFTTKVAGARAKVKSTIDAKCAALSDAGGYPTSRDSAFIGCAFDNGTTQQLSDCITRKADCAMCLVVNGTDDLAAPCDVLDDGTENGTCRQCGNGFAEPPEQCDDNGESDDCDPDCTYTACGDGYLNVSAGEICDDGNRTAGDGCQPNCNHCGDGSLQGGEGEECDDGNLVDGDGCDEYCRTQTAACPTKGELTLLAGVGRSCTTNVDCVNGSTCDTGLSRCTSASELDTGWSGLSHDADVNDGVEVSGDLLCDGAGPTCGQCDVTALIPKNDNCRCEDDSRAICDEPFKADLDDCGGALCNCYFGPPLPLSAGNTPACVVNRFAEDISGTANVDTGAGKIDSRLKSVVYLATSLVAPCPVCGGTCTAPAGKVGQFCGEDLDCNTTAVSGDGVCSNYDPTPNDGIRGGKCFGGPNEGQSCDIEATNATFPAPQGGGNSLDCFPPAGSNVSGTGLNLTLSQTTGHTELPAAALTCTGGLCPCGECSGDTLTACTSNADCTGIGNCVTNSERPNSCDDLTCTATGGGEGVCLVRAPDKFCDGILRANGEGFIGCQVNADCLPINIGLAAGNCTVTKQRECFVDPIEADGVQDANAPLGVSTLCIPRTANAGINNVAGLPGPARVKNQASSKLFCANVPANLYTPGVGCP